MLIWLTSDKIAVVNTSGPLDSGETTHKDETRGHAAVTQSRHARHGAPDRNRETAASVATLDVCHRVRLGSNSD